MNFIDIPLEQVKEAPFNYNLHLENQIDELCKSLKEFKQFKNIVLWQGYCIAGNGLIFAARKLGWKSLKAVVRDELTEEQAKRLCIADNATPYLAQPDSQKLEKLLKSLPSIDDIPGIDDNWVEQHVLTKEKLQEIPPPPSFDLPKSIQKIHFLISIPSDQYHLFHEKLTFFLESSGCEVTQSGN